MNFYDRYQNNQTQRQLELKKIERHNLEKEEKRKAEIAALPRMPVTIHTCKRNLRSKALRGLAAIVIDVRPDSGDPCYRLPYNIYHEYEMYQRPPSFESWDDWFEDYYTQLHARYEFNWLRAMHNPNIAFICDGKGSDTYTNRLSPREITAKYFIKVMARLGYTVTQA